MREIKFRAWHITDKKMLSHSDLVDMNICADTYLFSYEIFIPLQFTDLHDKNGKEIYEGDILKIRDCIGVPDKHISKVFWQNGGFQIENDSLDHDPVYLLGDVNMYSEVIGNIHENSELLKNSD